MKSRPLYKIPFPTKPPFNSNAMQNRLDHLAVSEAFLDLHRAWRNDPSGLLECYQSLNRAVRTASQAVSDRMRAASQQAQSSGPEALLHWVQNLAWSSRQYHQVFSQWLTEYVTQAPDLNAQSRKRALFWTRQIMEMLAPANSFWTNPKAVQRFIQSIRGLQNWLQDLQRGDGLLELTDPNAFAVGKNLAITPGQVVFRNALVEVIQYAPRTPTTWQIPIVLIQPWINKYYIFDLSPQNSLVQYLVHQGFTVFITSWKNPTADMRHVSFEDYMLQGALQAILVARKICHCAHVHAAGYCIGGTLLAAVMGWLAHESDPQPVVDVTLFASLLDFSEPGDLGALINPTSVEAIEQMLAHEGILKNHHMAFAFRMLNPGELIWRFVTNNYFNGESPPRSDMLYWNSDSTSLPQTMCSFYLKAFYLENRMARPKALVLAERAIDLKQVRQPCYVIGAVGDHICPWTTTFQTCRLVGGPTRYVLTSEGHITGIVNPPSQWSRKKYWAGAATRRRDAVKWQQKQKPLVGSWWPDWAAWLKKRSGAQVSPPGLGCKDFPALEPAPGSYVFE